MLSLVLDSRRLALSDALTTAGYRLAAVAGAARRAARALDDALAAHAWDGGTADHFSASPSAPPSPSPSTLETAS